MSDAEQEFDDVQTALAALCYYHYRQAGCPFGGSLTGLEAWIQSNVRAPFCRLVEIEDCE